MARAVLDEIGVWFETHVFEPLRSDPEPRRAMIVTCDAVEAYFRSGRRVCLVGVFALDETRDRFALNVRSYFVAWRDALAAALQVSGVCHDDAHTVSEEALALIQGGLVLARALNEPASFQRIMARTRQRLIDVIDGATPKSGARLPRDDS